VVKTKTDQKKSSQDLICPPKNKKMHFLNKMTSEKSFWSQNQQLVEVDVLNKKKRKLRRQNQESRKKRLLFFTNSLFLTPFLNSDFIYWQQK